MTVYEQQKVADIHLCVAICCLNPALGIITTLHYPQMVAVQQVVSSPDRNFCMCPAALLTVWTLLQGKLEPFDVQWQVIVGVVM